MDACASLLESIKERANPMNGELLKRIAQAFMHHDEKAFRAAMRQVITSERRQGHERTAEELAKIIADGSASSLSPGLTVAEPPTAFATVAREGSAIIDIRQPQRRFDEIVLAEETESRVRRFIEEYLRRDELSRYGLKPQLKLLLFGPPGNGKTYCADVIAAETGLPLFYVRFDSLVTSYLGETAANLRKAFDFATSHTGILLFDEFDAIGKSRDDREEVGELKRVVSSFLQLLDNYSGHSPIVAATNYEKLLDYALWRRFDSLIYFPSATQAQIERYLRLRLSAIPSSGFDPKEGAMLCAGMSYAEVSRIFTDSIKSMVLSGRKTLKWDVFADEVGRVRAAQEHRDPAIESASEEPENG